MPQPSFFRIRTTGGKLTPQPIRHEYPRRPDLVRVTISGFARRANAVGSHHVGNLVSSALNAVSLQLFMHTRAAVTLHVFIRVNSDYFGKKQGVSFLSRFSASRARTPGIIRLPGYFQYPAHLLHAEQMSVIPDEPVFIYGFLEKMATAFFRIS